MTWRFVAFKVFLDAWQLLMLTINPSYGWSIDASSKSVPVGASSCTTCCHMCCLS